MFTSDGLEKGNTWTTNTYFPGSRVSDGGIISWLSTNRSTLWNRNINKMKELSKYIVLILEWQRGHWGGNLIIGMGSWRLGSEVSRRRGADHSKQTLIHLTLRSRDHKIQQNNLQIKVHSSKFEWWWIQEGGGGGWRTRLSYNFAIESWICATL